MELNELIYAGVKLVFNKRTRTEAKKLKGKLNCKHR